MTIYSKINIIYRLQKWMDSVPGQTFLNYAYSWGASIVILGTLFKLTHLPGANFFLFLGMGTEVFVFFISAFDRPFDKTADGMELDIHTDTSMPTGQPAGGGTVVVGGSGGGAPATGASGETGGATIVVGGGGGAPATGGTGGGTIVVGGSGGTPATGGTIGGSVVVGGDNAPASGVSGGTGAVLSLSAVVVAVLLPLVLLVVQAVVLSSLAVVEVEVHLPLVHQLWIVKL